VNPVDELLHYLFENTKPYPDLQVWLKSSRTFRAFAETYKAKIRRKIRTVQEQQDVWFELQTAYLLLEDRRFVVEYEKYGATKGRGADFTVTFRANTVFNLEVTRLRPIDDGTEGSIIPKLIGVLVDKAGQTHAGMMNVLLIGLEAACTEAELKQAVNRLKTLADNKEEVFFERHGYQHAADFLKFYHQLSAGVIRQPGGVLIWLNRGARKPLLKELVTVFTRLPGL
jgi:hypothetical protein